MNFFKAEKKLGMEIRQKRMNVCRRMKLRDRG
jgi:hypothetical protein